MKVLGVNNFVAPANVAPSIGRAAPAAETVTQKSFGDVLTNMMKNVDQTLRSAEQMSVGALTGDVPIQKVVESVVAAEQKVQLTTAVRDKIVSAYLELTRMPI